MCDGDFQKRTISSALVKETARRVGFDACGMARAEAVSEERRNEYKEWLEQGYQADMDYLARNVEKKMDPRLLVEGARTMVCLAVNYYTPLPWNADEKDKNRWTIGRYALGTDYHEVVKGMLRRLMQELGLREGMDGRCFVDTAPVDEKYWAVQCGLGWRGKNSQLIVPQAGSYFFLGELVLTVDVDAYDKPVKPRCGHCHKCLDACPAGALLGNGTMDARKCLSYLTIEHRGPLPEGTGRLMGKCFYGCERCASVCPYNARFPSATMIAALQPRPEILQMKPDDWRQLSMEKYQSLFRKSAVKRAKYDGLMRNIEEMDKYL